MRSNTALGHVAGEQRKIESRLLDIIDNRVLPALMHAEKRHEEFAPTYARSNYDVPVLALTVSIQRTAGGAACVFRGMFDAMRLVEADDAGIPLAKCFGKLFTGTGLCMYHADRNVLDEDRERAVKLMQANGVKLYLLEKLAEDGPPDEIANLPLWFGTVPKNEDRERLPNYWHQTVCFPEEPQANSFWLDSMPSFVPANGSVVAYIVFDDTSKTYRIVGVLTTRPGSSERLC